MAKKQLPLNDEQKADVLKLFMSLVAGISSYIIAEDEETRQAALKAIEKTVLTLYDDWFVPYDIPNIPPFIEEWGEDKFRDVLPAAIAGLLSLLDD